MLYAVKANKQYPIDEMNKQRFINRGFRIAEFKNNKLVFEKAEGTGEMAELVKERAELKDQLTRANNRIEELEKELKATKGEGK